MSDGSVENSEGLASVSSSTIVVGHDGSRGASESFDVALDLAEQLSAPVVVVRCWNIQTAPRAPSYEFGYVSSFSEVSGAVHDALVKDCRTAVERHPSVSVGYRAALAHPAEALLELSADARMLVVGSRGLGGFASLLLGSVSDQCVRHGTCPVLVVRPRRRQKAADRLQPREALG